MKTCIYDVAQRTENSSAPMWGEWQWQRKVV